jgi:hypothetical protein
MSLQMTEPTAADKVYEWFMTRPMDMFKSGRIIDELERKIMLETDLGGLMALRELLAHEYAGRGRHSEAEALYLMLSSQQPDDPLPLISLAGAKLYYQNRPDEAMPIIDKAIDLAMKSGNLRRDALGTKARIALGLKSYGIVEDVLKQLINLKFVRGNSDCGIERDFFDRLPPGAIDPEVASDYDKFCIMMSRKASERANKKAPGTL